MNFETLIDLLLIFNSFEFHFIRSYRQRVITMKKESVYQANGGHTFFIPVEEGFKVNIIIN